MDDVNTSFVESHNQKIRMHTRRMTRLTAAHSKKIDNHVYALALYFAFHNFIKKHSTLGMTPAMAAGISGDYWQMSDIVALIDAANQPKPRGPYRKTVNGNGARISN
jgi:hypothetical protein